MLGLGKSKNQVEFSAQGKHPAFDDYFCLNATFPLASAVSAWIEKGVLSGGRPPKTADIHAYRFWMRGGKKEELVLGIIRDSSDRLGRPYPLMVMGKGFVDNWNKNWNFIFTDFDPVFREFENLSTSRYNGFKEFETRLNKIRFPKILSPDILSGEKTNSTGLSTSIRVWFKENRNKDVMSLPVAAMLDRFTAYSDQEREYWPFRKKSETPAAVFLGGLPDTSVLTIYNRPLKTKDYFYLFNVSKSEG